MAAYPALDVSDADGDRVLAVVDDYSPTGVEEHGGSMTVYFANPGERDRARRAVARELPQAVTSIRDVDDEDWARRSQASLTAVTVGGITIAPPWVLSTPATGRPPLTIAIAPSMGFGTGHHATTRLCLAALQALDLSGLSVLDVGTGSGVLAIAARLLGAQEAIGVDRDPDAVRSATENLALNPAADSVRFEVGDLWSASMKDADVVTANLTGALLARSASRLLGLVRSGGTLIVSGLQVGERSDVVHAFATAGPWRKFSEAPRALETMTRPARTGAPRERMSGAARAPRGASLTWEAEESGWVGLAFNLRAHLEV